MTKHCITPMYIVAASKDIDPDNLTTVMHVYKARSTYRSTIRGAFTKMQHPLILIHDEKYMCWTVNIGNHIYWYILDTSWFFEFVEHVSIGFGLWLYMKTNRYQLPLLEIVGVTSTKLNFSVGFAYFEHEREANFTWTLEKQRSCSHLRSFIHR